MNSLDDQRKQRMTGLAFMAAGIFLFTMQDIIIKGISGLYPVHEIVFVRSFLALPLIVVIAWFEQDLGRLRTKQIGAHALRGLIMFAAYTTYYLAIAAMPVATAVAISFSAPLFITVLAIPFLGERVSLVQLIAMVAGFAGVVIAMEPWDVTFDLAVTLPAISALFYALAQLYARFIGRTDSGAALAFYLTLTFIGLSGLSGLLTGSGAYSVWSHPSAAFLLRAWTWPTLPHLGLMLACGVIAALGVYCLSQGYRMAEAGKAALFEYTALPWAALWAFMFFNEIPTLNTILGVLLVVAAGISVAFREPERAKA